LQKKISLIPGATGKPTGILQIFFAQLRHVFSQRQFFFHTLCNLPTVPYLFTMFRQNNAANGQKKMTNTVPFIAYISSYPCNDDNNNVFSELRTEKKYDFFSLIVLTPTLNNPVITYT